MSRPQPDLANTPSADTAGLRHASERQADTEGKGSSNRPLQAGLGLLLLLDGLRLPDLSCLELEVPYPLPSHSSLFLQGCSEGHRNNKGKKGQIWPVGPINIRLHPLVPLKNTDISRFLLPKQRQLNCES